MRTAILTRLETGDEGTFGEMVVGAFKTHTLELPWRNNAKSKSCIPEGTYHFQWAKSPKHGECYEADPDNEAPNRTDIQIHSANLAGDTAKGYKSQLEGCIAMGGAVVQFTAAMGIGCDKPQRGVSGSRSEIAAFNREMKKEPFTMQIVWAPGIKPKESA
jgi:hypothetical protein